MLAAGFPDHFSTSFHSLLEFFRIGGWFMAPIVICWFISITIIIWKALDLRRRFIIPPELAAELQNVSAHLTSGHFPALQTTIQNDPSPLAKICRVALSPHHPTPEAAARSAETTAREEISRLERGIPVLEIIFTIAPMLGLIGTVSGLVRIFGSLGTGSGQTAQQAQQIALGIAEAMNATIAGLVVAVPALIAQVLYSRHLEQLALRMSTLVTDFLDTCWGQTAPVPEPAGARRPAAPLPRP